MTKINIQNKIKLDELREILDAEVLTGEDLLSKEVNMLFPTEIIMHVFKLLI